MEKTTKILKSRTNGPEKNCFFLDKQLFLTKQIPNLQVQCGTEWYDRKRPEVKLKIENRPDGCRWLRASFVNSSNRTVRFGGFKFDFKAFGNIAGERIRIYREGWTTASACGTVRYGECDFAMHPEYLKLSVTDPTSYDSNTPNRFSAEHVMVLNDRDTAYSLLIGFISSADQLTRLAVELDESGVKLLSAFSSGDGVEVDPGETVISEELVIMESNDGYALLESFAELWGKRMRALLWAQIPTGWCSWYYYFELVTEADILENIRFLSSHREEFPLKFIQLDDGYQAALGDWLLTNEKFPHGLEYIAESIKAAGFTPGIWLAPFMVEETAQLLTAHPDWLLKDTDGEIIWATVWRNNRIAVLDGTHPGVQEYFLSLFSTLAGWGFEYVKLDFLSWACIGSGGHYYDRKATRAQALRRGLAAIRKAMGKRFILGCTAPLGQVVGLVNGERIGPDVTPYWQPEREFSKEAPAMPNVCRNIINRSYMNGRLWISDPDTHICRSDNNKLSENEVLLWTYALYLTGGMVLLSDRFASLSPERAELSKLLLKNPGIFETRPLDFFEREYPSVWLRRDKTNGEILVGLFNFAANTQKITVDLRKIENGTSFRLEDVQTGQQFKTEEPEFTLPLPAHSCKLLKLS